MSKHTPSPWTGRDMIPVAGQDEAGISIGFINTHSEERRAEAKANARLIAAAPDLLESLRRVLSSQTINNPDPDSDPDVIFAHAAIAKATGETP